MYERSKIMNISKSLLSAAFLFPGLALAHGTMQMSVPAANSTVKAMPEQIMLHFSEPTKITAVSIAREGSKEKQDLKVPSDAKTMQTIAAPKLEPGVYVIDWRGMSGDSHMIKGSVRFTLAGK